jgi:hypothetical protein
VQTVALKSGCVLLKKCLDVSEKYFALKVGAKSECKRNSNLSNGH